MSKSTCSFDGCVNASRARGWCWPHYKQWHRGEEQRPVGYRKPPEERFWSKFKVAANGCWEWQDSLSLGYGHISLLVDGESSRAPAHRFSYELAYGPIPDGADIDHICHNRACVNPEHLRAASRKQNAEHRLGAQINSKTGVRGVYFERKGRKYIAIVNHHGKRHYVGSFHDLEEASSAVRAKRLELFTHNDEDRKAA